MLSLNSAVGKLEPRRANGVVPIQWEKTSVSALSQAKVLSYLAFWSSADWTRTTLILYGNPLYSALPI